MLSKRVVAICVGIAALSALCAADTITVYPPCGDIGGIIAEDGTYQFRGIPYAEAPVGERRWAPTEEKKPWTAPLDAAVDGPGCPQQCLLPPHTCPEAGTSEDCLFLNVFAPNTTFSGTKLPVMVYFHGGNYKQGLAGGPLYNGSYLAREHDVIAVVVNYRLGALGFMAIPELGINGNFGILDQQMALKWVQTNIPSFGGDISRVTVFGQSAGAGSIATHYIAPSSKGLFSRGILQSNPFTIPFRDTASMPKIANAFLKNAKCTQDAACLRKLDVEDVIKAQVATETDLDAIGGSLLHLFLPWTPYVDGKVVPEQPLVAMQKGRMLSVPTMIGTVLEESVPFIYAAFDTPVDKLKYEIFAGLIFGDARSKKVLARYPGNSTDNRETLVTVGSEYIFHCAVRNATAQLARLNPGNTYLYMFDHLMSFSKDGWGPDFPECYDRVCHAEELAFVWNSADWLFPYTKEEKAFASAIGRYFTNFAKTGNPNKASLNSPVDLEDLAGAVGLARLPVSSTSQVTVSADPQWPSFTLNGLESIRFSIKNGGIRTEKGWLANQCNFWDSINYL